GSALPAHADAIASLRAFNAATRSVTAEFTQRVLNERLKEVQNNTGYLAIERPGRFRWVYKTPNEQILVSDGKLLWLYDPELKQVTRRGIGGAMSGTPAALLAGNAEVEAAYKLSNIGQQNGLDWLEARPKRQDSGFVRIRIDHRNDLFFDHLPFHLFRIYLLRHDRDHFLHTRKLGIFLESLQLFDGLGKKGIHRIDRIIRHPTDKRTNNQ
ncbi:MAG: outer membrane lipoprotein carrier protein LolA, partial [Verrucomicrobia bacterium]|nr:outer membrane lipoprotein carrier protein LolA [Verrucomicrobiota bacterium]